MEIKTRRVGKYVDVTLEVNDTTVALGLHDKDECLALAKTLKTAISYLLETDQYEN